MTSAPGLLLRLAARDLARSWRHALGAALGVAVGFAALALFDGYLGDFEAKLRDVVAERFMMGTLVVEGRGAGAAMSRTTADPVYLGEPEQAFLEEYLRTRAPEVRARVRSLFVGGVASNGHASTPFIGWGYDVEEGAALRRRFAWDAWAGRPLREAGGDAVLLARGLGLLLECAPGSAESPFGPGGLPVAKERPFACRRPRIQLVAGTASGQVNAVEPVVAGLTDGGRKELETLMVTMPLGLAQRLRNARDVSLYNVLLRDPSAAAPFSRDLVVAARARGLALEAMPWQESYFGQQYRQGMGILRTFRGLMAVVVLALAGMTVTSTMAKSVDERTREIGTLRSLGFLRRHVAALFVAEAAMLSAAACVAGALVAAGAAGLVNGARVTYDTGVMVNPIPLGVAIDPLAWLRIGALLVGVACLAAWLPARRAARRRIPDALAWA